MPALDRVLGLYLSLTYVVVVVACHHLWRRGLIGSAVALLLSPLAVWYLWAYSEQLPSYARVVVDIDLIPVTLAIPLAALAWIMVVAPEPDSRTGIVRRVTDVARQVVGPTRARTVMWLLSAAGLAWFGYGYRSLPSACAFDGTGSLPALSSANLRKGFLCASTAMGLWPLLALVVIAVVVGIQQRLATDPAIGSAQ
ncbi:MAG: hypothetical protein U0132_15115 [Gemmatimonadaceae bacterium]